MDMPNTTVEPAAPTALDGQPAAPSEPPASVPPPPPQAPPEPRGCLYALSQPPLMLFLSVIAVLLAVTGAYDLFVL
ncbi:hypothetical protein [Streptomyces sp. HNM0574]|uniref:hypothetical protein n=1 Tax=Streptomyces sp. HNM0574 TaxID=2714954 RepID=UPI0019CFA26D|nr:hypothetical protein [Streptomyces sp. HNM0574]